MPTNLQVVRSGWQFPGTNLVFSGLSPAARLSVLAPATAVELPVHTVLYEAFCVPRYGYFLLSGLASIAAPMQNGESVEVGIIGREGVVGGLHLLGRTRLPTRCVMQLAGSALQVPFPELQKSFAGSIEVRSRILELIQEQTATLAQTAACNSLHSVEQRLARWLLMAQDRTQSDTLAFIHEYLAEMMGVQRSTVTVIAGRLQARDVIRYSRGRIHILNRLELEATACECYRTLKGTDGTYQDTTDPVSIGAASSLFLNSALS